MLMECRIRVTYAPLLPGGQSQALHLPLMNPVVDMAGRDHSGLGISDSLPVSHLGGNRMEMQLGFSMLR